MAEVVSFNKKNGAILSMRIKLTTAREKEICRSFVESEPALDACPTCGKDIKAADVETMELVVASPASTPIMGFYTAEPIIHCPHCGEALMINAMMDISPFTNIVEYCKKLKASVENNGKEGKK